jgi:single-stranded DNA-binding protein
MSDDRDILFACIGFGGGIWWFFHGFKLFRKKQLIENIPTSKVRGMAMGLVELCGRAKRQTFLKGPLSQEDCVAYTYLIERYERREKSSSWVTIAKGNSFQCSFDLEDDTGHVTIILHNVEFIVDAAYSFSTEWGKPLPANLVNFMTLNHIAYRGFFGSQTLRFTERSIRPGDPIYVLGTAKKIVSSVQEDQIRRSRLVERLNEVKSDPKFMAQADTNKDGHISEDEWQRAVLKVEQELLQNEMSQATEDIPDVVIGQGETEKTFIVSNKSQEDLDQSFAWQMIGGIFGGATVTVACLWYLLVRFGIF